MTDYVPNVAPGTTTFTLQDGTEITLADWIDDRLFSTITVHRGGRWAVIFTDVDDELPEGAPGREELVIYRFRSLSKARGWAHWHNGVVRRWRRSLLRQYGFPARRRPVIECFTTGRSQEIPSP